MNLRKTAIGLCLMASMQFSTFAQTNHNQFELPQQVSLEQLEDFSVLFPLKGIEVPETKIETAFSFGAGSTGGGQGSDGFLRDLQSGPEFKCNQKMNSFVENYPTFNAILSKFSAINIGFAAQIMQEMKLINVCMVNGELNTESLGNQDGIIISDSQYKQLAIRVMYNTKNGRAIDVYLNKEEFENMNSEEGQSFLLLHEIMHSFINKEPAISYINRLRGFVREVYDSLTDDNWTLDDMNSLATSYGMDHYKTPLQYARIILNNEKLVQEKVALIQRLIEQDTNDYSREDLKLLASSILYSANYKKVSPKSVIQLLQFLERKNLVYTGSIYEDFQLMTILDSALLNYNLEVITYIIQKNNHDKELLLEPNNSISLKNMKLNELLSKDYLYGNKAFNRTTVVYFWNNLKPNSRKSLMRTLRQAGRKSGSSAANAKAIIAILKN